MARHYSGVFLIAIPLPAITLRYLYLTSHSLRGISMAASEHVDRFKAECVLFDMALKNNLPLTEQQRQDLRSKLHQLIFAMDIHTPIVASSDHPSQNKAS